MQVRFYKKKRFPSAYEDDDTRTLLPEKLLSARVFPDSQSQRLGGDPPAFPPPGGKQDASKAWAPGGGGVSLRGFGGAGGEVDEETKKNQNIINIVREGQISLLVGVPVSSSRFSSSSHS